MHLYITLFVLSLVGKSISGLTVPIIDISALIRDSNDSAIMETASLIGNACREVGFFIILGHNVDRSVVDAAWEATSQFFELDLDEKLQYVKPQEIYPFGYTPLGGETLSAGKDTEVTQHSDQSGNNNSIHRHSSPPDLKGMIYCIVPYQLPSTCCGPNYKPTSLPRRDVLDGAE